MLIALINSRFLNPSLNGVDVFNHGWWIRKVINSTAVSGYDVLSEMKIISVLYSA